MTVSSIRAARGTELSCRGWQQEAALRMLQNNLDPEVAEHPSELVVYGGTGKAARDWPSYEAIVRTLKTLADDETLLVQSGKPVGVLQTHEWAPRVLLANSNLVGDWANWDEFRRLEALGLTMYGQMTAGSWIYIGSQGILQGTYETFAAVGEKRFGGSLAGTITLDRRPGRDGRRAAAGGDDGRRRLHLRRGRPVADRAPARDAATSTSRPTTSTTRWRWRSQARDARRPLSIGLLGNCADVFPELLSRGAPIDVVTDQTSAHDPLAYLPSGVDFEDWARGARAAGLHRARARESMARHVEAMVGFQDRGAEVFDYGNSLRAEAQAGRLRARLRLPRLRPGLHPAAVLRGPRAVPLGRAVRRSGRHRRHRQGRARPLPRERVARALDEDGGREGPVPGPAGADLLARPGRAPPRRPAPSTTWSLRAP